MKTENQQLEHIMSINDSPQNEILIVKTGKEEVNLPKHIHSKHQIIYTLSGTLHIELETGNYFLPEGHIAWIPDHTVHQLSSKNSQISLVIFYFFLKNIRENSEFDQFAVFNTNTVILENLKFIHSQGEAIRERDDKNLYVFSLSFFKLLPGLGQSLKMPLQALAMPEDERLLPILKYISEYAHEDLKMENIADMFGFSVRNLSRLFQNSGIQFNHYLNYQRIMQAIELFAENDRTMQQIAYEVGFSTPTNFNRVFKRIMGISPGSFKRK